jgi:hypothetical protein
MEPTIRLFDGEEEISTTRAELTKYSATQIVSLLESTAVFRDVLKDFDVEEGGIGIHSVVAINGRKPSTLMELQVERGYLALYGRLCELLGEDSATIILAKIINAINLEKCTD